MIIIILRSRYLHEVAGSIYQSHMPTSFRGNYCYRKYRYLLPTVRELIQTMSCCCGVCLPTPSSSANALSHYLTPQGRLLVVSPSKTSHFQGICPLLTVIFCGLLRIRLSHERCGSLPITVSAILLLRLLPYFYGQYLLAVDEQRLHPWLKLPR